VVKKPDTGKDIKTDGVTMRYDIIIIGAGPAGLTAAIYGARGGFRTAIFEKGMVGGQINVTEHVENYPGFVEVQTGYELTASMRAQAEKFGAEFIEEDVTAIALEGLCKVLETTGGTYLAKTIIFATGAHPRKLNIPGEDKFTGRGVSYCATCDGALYRGKTVAVIGGGDSALEEGLFLTKFCEKVYIIHRREELRAQHIIQVRAKEHPQVEFLLNNVPLEIKGDKFVTEIELHNKIHEHNHTLKVDGVFVYVGILPNNELVENRLELDAEGFIRTDEEMITNIPGIFAAGDIRSKKLRQVVTACSDGAIAAWNAEKWIMEFTGQFGE
jgi:thioredoxin reductase (NADPH)